MRSPLVCSQNPPYWLFANISRWGEMMSIRMRMVCQKEWRLSHSIGIERLNRLSEPPEPETLLEMIAKEALDSASKGHIDARLKESCECPGYYRVEAKIPISSTIFDLFFNGRSGYRAQFYLSPEEGLIYNRRAVEVLMPAVRVAHEKSPIADDYSLIERSLLTPHAKIWVDEERAVFDEAQEYTLNPDRWVRCSRSRGRKAPLPQNPRLDLKGAFIDPSSSNFFVDQLKADRSCDLFCNGYT